MHKVESAESTEQPSKLRPVVLIMAGAGGLTMIGAAIAWIIAVLVT